MSEAALDAALGFVLHWEGGFSDNPADPGGATMHGVTQRVYDAYRHNNGRTIQTVKLIARVEVRDLYKSMYWEPSHAYEFDYPLALTLFDTAIQFGVHGAMEFVRETFQLGPQDDPVARMKQTDAFSTALRIVALRKSFRHERVSKHPEAHEFLQGWLNRDDDLGRECQIRAHEFPSPATAGQHSTAPDGAVDCSHSSA